MMRVASSAASSEAPLCRPSKFGSLTGHCSGDGGRPRTVFIGLIDILTQFGAYFFVFKSNVSAQEAVHFSRHD